MTVAILVTLLLLAAANGANDVSKGVSTLAGAGVTAYRTAVAWGAVTTLIGALLSIEVGRSMGKLFSKGIVDGAPTAAFALAVLVGATSWVAFASLAKLPVSTTQAIIGSLVGAGLVLAPTSVQWSGVLQRFVLPLLLSIVVAYGISAALAIGVQLIRRRRTAGNPEIVAVGASPVGGRGTSTRGRQAGQSTDGAGDRPNRARLITVLHWVSSGATGCARGLNDTPKIAAVGGFALLPAGFSATSVSLMVATAMAGGSLFGIRVARTLGEKVVRMSHTEGFTANATTACLVGAGAVLALPMSTTQVSTGAIVGSAGGQLSRISGRTLRDFAIAWTATPVCAGLVAAVVFGIAA